MPLSTWSLVKLADFLAAEGVVDAAAWRLGRAWHRP
jgi:hypothetical protein